MSETRHPRLDVDPELLRRLYVDEMASTAELCKRFHMNVLNLIATLDHHGIPRRRKRGPRSPKHHGSWKGGRHIDKTGYVLIRQPTHPHANSGGYVREHRLVMEQMIGRLLDPAEVVHHKNGQKQDNRPENLELFSKNSDHLRHELTGRCPKWTEDGKERIREGARRPRGPRRRSPATAPLSSPPDVPPSSESSARPIDDTPTEARSP